jgi:hypothetical protein
MGVYMSVLLYVCLILVFRFDDVNGFCFVVLVLLLLS